MKSIQELLKPIRERLYPPEDTEAIIDRLLRCVERMQEGLYVVSIRKEGFAEDNYRCIEEADEALDDARKILEGGE